jgi:hypothetical protein
MLAALQEEPAVVSDDHPDGSRTMLASPGGGEEFAAVEVSKSIHATRWQGTIVVEASADGEYAVSAAGHD